MGKIISKLCSGNGATTDEANDTVPNPRTSAQESGTSGDNQLRATRSDELQQNNLALAKNMGRGDFDRLVKKSGAIPSASTSGSPSQKTEASPRTLDNIATSPTSLPLHPALSGLSDSLPVAVSAGRPTRVRLTRPGEPKQPPMHVETSTLTHLRMAQQLIGRIGSDPSVRMGNQISDVIATNGESWARVKRMVDWYEENYNRPPLDPRVLAEIAVSFKAYDCIHANARAFVEVVAQGIDVPVFLVRSGTHSYVLIGNVETPGAREEDIVVLDLWPRFPMAHTLRDARHKFPLRGEHESAGAYANRLERLDWTISGWRPGQTDFLDGYDFSGTSVKNHDGVLYNGQETPKGTPGDEFDDGLGTYAARHDRDDGLFDEIFDESGGRSSIDNKRSLAQFDPQQYLTSRLGQDPLGAILPQVGNEWLFSTEQPGRLYVADSQIEPLSFNEFSQRDWEAWQDAIVQLRLKDSKSGVVRLIVEDYYDVPRGAPPRGRSYVGESASDSDQGRGR